MGGPIAKVVSPVVSLFSTEKPRPPAPAPTPAPMADATPADFEKLTAQEKEDFFQAWQAQNSA